MSIRAMNWAMSQRTDGVSAQCVLYIIADTANEHGVSIHADPDYIASRTRQSRATVFRRLKELEDAGALTRLKRFREDGAPVYELRLHLEVEIDYAEVVATGDDDPQDVEAKSQIETPTESQIETGKVSPVRQAESQSCDSKSPSKNPEEDPPNPPSGGDRVVDEELEADIDEFTKNYPAPITNLPRLRTILAAMIRDERRKVLRAEKGYASFIAECERKGKPRAVKDAHRWVADGSWEGYVVSGERAEAHARMRQVPIDSPEGKALIVLHRIAGMQRPFETCGKFLLMVPMTPAELALADAPDQSTWKFIPADARNQCGAWNDFVADAMHGKPRPELINNRNPGGASGFMAPWPWPPRKDGTLCDTAA